MRKKPVVLLMLLLAISLLGCNGQENLEEEVLIERTEVEEEYLDVEDLDEEETQDERLAVSTDTPISYTYTLGDTILLSNMRVERDPSLGHFENHVPVEVEIGDEVLWGIVEGNIRNYGLDYFYVNIRMTNVGDYTTRCLSFFRYNQIGESISGFHYREDNLAYNRGELEPGESVEGTIMFLYEGDGTYAIRFGCVTNPTFVGIPVTIGREGVILTANSIVRHQISQTVSEFEQLHALPSDREWVLAFSPFVLVNNSESPRVFPVMKSDNSARYILRTGWGVTSGEDAVEQMERLATAQQQSLVADEIFNVFVRDGLVSLEEVMEVIQNNSSELGELMEASERRLIRLLEENPELGDFEDLTSLERSILVTTIMEERVISGLNAFSDVMAMLIHDFDYTERELLAEL